MDYNCIGVLQISRWPTIALIFWWINFFLLIYDHCLVNLQLLYTYMNAIVHIILCLYDHDHEIMHNLYSHASVYIIFIFILYILYFCCIYECIYVLQLYEPS